jgi:serine/threonine protein kinase
MVQPEMEGMEVLSPIGEGACGSIFIARDLEGSEPTLPDTKWYAVRVFNAIAINRPLIENMVRRLQNGSYPKSVVPIVWKDSKQGSSCMIMPMLADVDEDKLTIAIRSLQDRLDNYPEADAWPVVEKLARALGEMHQRKIAHGNLKPGNIFFNQDDSLCLTDFAMGQMPGVSMLPFTDALLYAPPEQLREPDGYLEGKGYAWDNYAFAVIAFRLLTGKFPRCEATFHQVAPEPGERHVTGIEADLIKMAERLEHRELEGWSGEASDAMERKRRAIIHKCLSLDPEQRYSDMNEVLRAWDDIDADARAADEKAGLLKRAKISKLAMVGSLALAGACVFVCILLSGFLAHQKYKRSADLKEYNETIALLEQETKGAKVNASLAIKAKRDTETSRQAIQQQAATSKASLLNQLNALSATNDHLVEWLMRTTNKDFPELSTAEPASEIIADELRELLKVLEGDQEASLIRTAALIQLAELEIHRNQTSDANAWIDKAEAQAAELTEQKAEFAARLARARLICLLQAFDNGDSKLAELILPKARKNIDDISGGDANEVRRINAVMQIIDGYVIEKTKPEMALKHFQLALKDLDGIHQALPEHIAIRSRISHYALKSATIAESMELFDDATKLRGKAADHLRSILKKNPKLTLAKVDLAKIEILSAEAEMQAGNDTQGTAKLKLAESLLSGLSTEDTNPHGASMQKAIAMSLRSVLLRDLGKRTEAAKLLEQAISIVSKIVETHPEAREPLYRLAVFHWQRAGLYGDARDTKSELAQGKQAAELMQRLLKKGAQQKEVGLRRSLAYLYGDLGYTAQNKGLKSDAVAFYKNATTMWQSLIDVHGKNLEYMDGLKWSKSRYRGLGGR